MRCFVAAALVMVMLGAGLRPALAGGALVGVNTVDVAAMNQQEQTALLGELLAAHVTTIRLDLKPGALPFIIAAYGKGIGSIAIVPFAGNPARARPEDEAAGLSWAQVPLSAPDQSVFTAKDIAPLNRLDAAHVRLAALEFGNEINNASFNGDFTAQGHGQVYGEDDITAAATPETAAIRAGFLAYLTELKWLKQWRDASPVNGATALISAGLADPGQPRPGTGHGADWVSIPGTLGFLRANGLDALADGYGVHVYPSNNPALTEAARTQPLLHDTFSACVSGGKPCWLTEYGFTNKSTACPLDDASRAGIMTTMHAILAPLAASGQLRAAIYFSWSGHLGVANSPEAIYRCGALTQAGHVALEPF